MEVGVELGSIDRELFIDAAPEVVFEVVSAPEYIRQWWSAETEYEPVAGATAQLTWTDEQTGEKESTPFTVVEVDRPRTFSFRWTYDEDSLAAQGNSLLVTFTLVPTGTGTTLRFTETGYRERGWEAAVLEEYYNDHTTGWDLFLPRLAETARRVTV
jgi:uncharacterized protein YndB with AHSA1/START domain